MAVHAVKWRAPALDFNHNSSSLIMALLGFAAVACYTLSMFLLAEWAKHLPATSCFSPTGKIDTC